MSEARVGARASESNSFFGAKDSASPSNNQLKPDVNVIGAHFEALFSSPSRFADGLIEISTLRASRFFKPNELNSAATYAADTNAKGNNVYVCAAMLVPDVEVRIASRGGGRARKADFLCAPCAWVDVDAFEGDENELSECYAPAVPSWVTITGRKPSLRAHLWWRLCEPTGSIEEIQKINRDLVAYFSGDRAATDATRLMRIAGSVAWPTKSGRIVELTEGRAL